MLRIDTSGDRVIDDLFEPIREFLDMIFKVDRGNLIGIEK
jgi:hypothetical protein